MRLDLLLVRHGLAASRERARALIEAGSVLVDGLPALKAATQVSVDQQVRLADDDFPWVGRGALKLLGALEDLPVAVRGAVAADLGCSTGGFTEVLLHQGAARVHAVDVGRGVLHQRLRTDPRVVVVEGTNIRHLGGLGEPIDLVVGDLSFISLTLILPVIALLLRPGGEALVLVKPQFEVGRQAIGRGGRVRSEGDRTEAIAMVAAAAEAAGFAVDGGADARVAGARAGNVEHFLRLRC